MKAKRRIEKWDILKFFLIFLVVLGHIVQNFKDESGWMNALFFWIYTFHMPLFIFISGMFSKRTVNEKNYDKMIVFLFLYFITKIILFVSRIIAYGTFSLSFVQNGDMPWYMLAIFVFFLITAVLKNFSPKFVLPLVILIACVAGYDTEIGDKFAFMRIIVFYPFFYAGYCLDSEKVVRFTDKKYIKVIAVVVLIAFTAFVFLKIDFVYQFKPLLTGRGNFESLKEYRDYGVLLRLLYYAAAFIVGAAVISLTPNRLSKKRIISKMGSRSLQVYMLHYVFIHFADGRLKDYIALIPPAAAFFGMAIIITLICSLKFWEPVFKKLMNPPKIKKIQKQ